MGKHVITLYISIKTLIFHHMEVSKRHGQGSAPQEQSDWDSRRGVSKLVPLKTTNTALNLSLFPPRSSTCSLTDDPEASVALDTRL